MRKAIIAILGGNSDVGDILGDVSTLCASIGNQCILLSGGRPTNAPTTVKDAALSAVQATGLMISVLPDAGSSRVFLKKKERRLIVQTDLSPEGRDPITGAAADLIVVFRGGTGTLVELAYAAFYKRRIIFVNSADDLNDAFKKERAEFNTKLQIAVESYLPSRPYSVKCRNDDDRATLLRRSLKARLKKAKNSSTPISIQKVTKFLNNFGKKRKTNFLGLDAKNDEFKVAFEREVRILSSLA